MSLASHMTTSFVGSRTAHLLGSRPEALLVAIHGQQVVSLTIIGGSGE